MTTFRLPKWLTSISLALLALVGVLHACQVPVFRYALERWESDKYQLFLVSPEQLTDNERTIVDDFKKSLPDTNLVFTEINLGALSEADLWKLPDIDTSITTPQLFLFSPEKHNKTSPIVVKPLSEKSLHAIIDSPARRQIVGSLVEGQSCVWLVVHNGQPAEANKLQHTLDQHLKSTAASIELPEGIIGTEQRSQITQSTDLEDVLRSSIPLKISFVSQVLDIQDAAESSFVATLLEGIPATIQQLDEPLIFPIFGRGRKISPITASELSLENVRNGSLYLCGACSCQVKEQNPGTDLLISEDWPAHLTDGLAVIEKELPPLTGAAELTPQKDKIKQPLKATNDDTHPVATSPNYWFIGIATLLLSLLAASTFVILRKK